MRGLIAEIVLTDGPIRWHNEHLHRLDDIADHVIVATRWDSKATYRRDLAVVEDYSQALDMARAGRERTAIEDGYAVVESVYTCGCRSDGPYYQQGHPIDGVPR